MLGDNRRVELWWGEVREAMEVYPCCTGCYDDYN